MAFVFAVGLVFANTTTQQTAGWIALNGVATQLQNAPCEGTGNNCRVYFANNPSMIYDVFETSQLEVRKTSASPSPHLITE